MSDVLLEKDNELLVHCSRITPTYIFYKCPYCWITPTNKIKDSPFKKNGTRFKTIKQNSHRHGNPGYLTGTYFKSSHCTINNKKLCIVIDQNSKRTAD